MTEPPVQLRQYEKLRKLDAAWSRLVGKLSEGAAADNVILKGLILEINGARQQLGLPSFEEVSGAGKASERWQ